METAGEPADRWNLAYLSYLVLGMGTLFPWNAFITAADYFEAQYPGRHADRLFTISYLPINLAVLLLVVRHHARVRPVVRIVGGFVGFTLAVSAVPLLDMAGPADAALGVILGLVALCGVCDGFAQGALFGDAAALPPKFTQALVSGTGISGVVVCLLRVLTKATLPDTPEGLRASASAYFALAALICGSCIALYSVLIPRLPVIAYYRQAAMAAALSEAVEWGAVAGAAGTAGGKRSGLSGVGEDEGEGYSYVEGQALKAAEAVHGAAGSGLSGPSLGLLAGSRVASPEKLTDMVEEEPLAPVPAADAAATQRSRRSTDVELVPEGALAVLPAAAAPASQRGGVSVARRLGQVGGGDEGGDTMQQRLLQGHHRHAAAAAGEQGSPGPASGLSDSYYSLHEEPTSSPLQPLQNNGGVLEAGSGGGQQGRGWLWGALQRLGLVRGRSTDPDEGQGTAAAGQGEADYLGVLRQLWRSAAANVVIYTVTLCIFPGVLAEDVSSARLGSWYPVALITAFNFADLGGKATPGIAALRLRSEQGILGAAAARALFIPAFHFAATDGSGPAVIGLLTLLLGASNGYLTSCAMIGARERVGHGAAALAGNLMVLSLVLGLCIGAAAGFLWLL